VPFSAISIALVVNKKAVLGVVLNPHTAELFAARKSGGGTSFIHSFEFHVYYILMHHDDDDLQQQRMEKRSKLRT
jgi:3'-phosphoadenosine 5'-phosphosulfate (PAPS) 3'-phosphatase